MNRKSIFTFLLIISILNSCQYGLHSKKIEGNYYLTYVDDEFDTSVSYMFDDGSCVGVVNDGVYAVGFNSDFIIVKAHPFYRPNFLNRDVTNFYIIPLNNTVPEQVDENKIGPLTEPEFNKMREKLNIPQDIGFTMEVNYNK